MSIPILMQVEWYGGYFLLIAVSVGLVMLYDRFFPRRDNGSWGFGHGGEEWLPLGPNGKPDWKKFHEELDEIGKTIKVEEEESRAVCA